MDPANCEAGVLQGAQLCMLQYENRLINGSIQEINERLAAANAEGYSGRSVSIHNGHVYVLMERPRELDDSGPQGVISMQDVLAQGNAVDGAHAATDAPSDDVESDDPPKAA